MHAMSVYIAREQFIHHQPVMCTLARSKDFCTRVVRALLHTRVLVKFKSSCTVIILCNKIAYLKSHHICVCGYVEHSWMFIHISARITERLYTLAF